MLKVRVITRPAESRSRVLSYANRGLSPAAEMAMRRPKMDLRQSEMRPLSLMRRQITAAKVFDGDQMEAELQVSLPEASLEGGLGGPRGLIRHETGFLKNTTPTRLILAASSLHWTSRETQRQGQRGGR